MLYRKEKYCNPKDAFANRYQGGWFPRCYANFGPLFPADKIAVVYVKEEKGTSISAKEKGKEKEKPRHSS